MDAARAPLSEAEFEEIMNRNRAISSSAISRAVSDASAGKDREVIGHVGNGTVHDLIGLIETMFVFQEITAVLSRHW